MSPRTRISIAVAVLALALLAPTSAAAIERTVSVTANATLDVPNDSAGLGLSVGRERRTRGAALRAVAASLREVIAVVQATPGVGPGDLSTSRITVRRIDRGKRPIYRAAEGVGVILHQPDRAGELVSAAIAAGATGVNGPNFFVGDTEAAFTSALTVAFDKAKARAEALAARAGAILGPALTIDEGAPTVTPQAKLKAAPACGVTKVRSEAAASKRVRGRCAGTPLPVEPGTSTVTATVHVVFALQ